MNKIYMIYLMCAGISLIFLSTYFSYNFPDYTNSIFYIVNIMLLSSILIFVFLKNSLNNFTNKLVVFSNFFLLAFFALLITKNLYYLTNFGEEVISVFSIFFIMSSISLMLVSSISLTKEEVFNNNYFILTVFSPIIIYSLWVLLNNSLFLNTGLVSQIPLRLFLVAFTSLYTALIFYNMLISAVKILAYREKYFLITIGIGIILLFSGYGQAGFIPEITPILTVFGCFILCLGLLMESNLKLHNKILSDLLASVKKKKKKDFLKYLRTQISRDKGLKAKITRNKILLFDNPNLSNLEEKKKYDHIIVLCFKWFRRHVKNSDNLLNKLKKFYNHQKISAKRLNLFLV